MLVRRLLPWVLAFFLLTGICVLVGIVAQQTYRQSANDPQIQLAEEMSVAFENNQFTDETLQSSFSAFIPSKIAVNLASSASPWIQVYGDSGDVLLSSAKLETDSTVHVPKQVFEEVHKKGEYRGTWEPKKGIRQAIVITKFSGLKNGYIVVGRSLREGESRVNSVYTLVAIGWGIMIGVIIISALWSFGFLTKFR